MKVKKILLSVILVAVAIMLISSSKTYAAVGSWKLGAEKIREGINTIDGREESRTDRNPARYSYKMATTGTPKPVLKIVDKTSGRADFSNAIYCLKAGQGFGSDNQTISDVVYDRYYNMVTEKSSVNSVINLTDANYNSVLWLLDNIYLPKQTPIADRQTTKYNFLYRAFRNEFTRVDSLFYDMDPTDLIITDDDIEVVQQWALWYFTNENESNSNLFHTDTLPNMFVSSTGNDDYENLGDQIPELGEEYGYNDTVRQGYIRQEEAKVLYNYLITQARANSNYTKNPTVISLNKTLTQTAKQSTVLNTNYTVIGPFEIQKTGNTSYEFNGTVVDKNGREVSYTICDADGNQVLGIRTLSEAVGNGQFYIRIERLNLTTNKIKGIKLKINYTTSDGVSTFWTKNGSTVDQPVVVIDRNPTPVEDEISVDILEFDLALRKYITSVTRNGATLNLNELTGRVPNINKGLLATETTAEYKHRKDPVPVETGDLVNYTITIYNEGEIAGRATKIVDYLPDGLEFYSAISTDYNFQVSADKRSIIITPKNSTNLPAYSGGTLSSVDIKFTCKVTKKAEKTSAVLTNIAEITEAYDVNNIKRHIEGDDRDSIPNNLRRPSDTNLPTYKGNESNKAELNDSTYFYKGQQDDDDFEKLKVTTPEFDLALRKFITYIDSEKINGREPIVDTTPLKNGFTTAKYTHPKNPLTVRIGSIVRYTIRVYNEADIDGYATVIEDYLPEELELVPVAESTINAKYGWTANGRVVTTTYLDGKVITAYDGGNTLDYEDVEIECRVKDTENLGKILTNIAQINGDNNDDRDSIPANVVKPSDANLPDYEENQQDDDDYEKVRIYQPEYDLALRKFITQVNTKEITTRIPTVDVGPLTDNSDQTTTAIYTHPKDPILVRNGDIVVYTIRVYNEGKLDAFAQEVKDNIPEGLEFIIDNEINIEYRWLLSNDEKEVSTDYLSKERDENNVIKAFDSDTMDTLDYKDVKIAFKVVEPDSSTRIITNIAEIKDDDGNDIDSTPDNDKENEDDIDVEHIKLSYFDLALRKFITKVESKSGENLPVETDTTKDVSREPKVEIGEDGKIKYIHPKDPVVVANSDIVIYTLRVYNEGTIDGFAEEIKDDVPLGLELVPRHAINIQYRWVMYDENGNVTTDETKAKTIRTTYLSEESNESNKIIAFDRDTMQTPAYKDVQVAFRVVEKNANNEDRIVINTAEISKDSDDDIDSTPDNDKENEDDIDKEYIKLKYFDLSLLKWVNKVMVTEKGVTKVTETGYNGLENPEPVVKLEVKPNQMKSIVIKYEYGIRITNEGQIPGYAKEITDYVPEGLEFIPEDNPLWTMTEQGVIKTTQLENTLLQPGESAVVTVIFKWKNGEDNFGTKENWAEISKDDNEKDAPDIDSTPGNVVFGEDDIDNALVVLSPKTGIESMYIVLPTTMLTILIIGVILIKRYVL